MKRGIRKRVLGGKIKETFEIKEGKQGSRVIANRKVFGNKQDKKRNDEEE